MVQTLEFLLIRVFEPGFLIGYVTGYLTSGAISNTKPDSRRDNYTHKLRNFSPQAATLFGYNFVSLRFYLKILMEGADGMLQKNITF